MTPITLSPCSSTGNSDITTEQKVEIAFLMDAFKIGLARCLKVDKVFVVMVVNEPQACALHSTPHVLTNVPFPLVPHILANGIASVLNRAEHAERISAAPVNPTGKAS